MYKFALFKCGFITCTITIVNLSRFIEEENARGRPDFGREMVQGFNLSRDDCLPITHSLETQTMDSNLRSIGTRTYMKTSTLKSKVKFLLTPNLGNLSFKVSPFIMCFTIGVRLLKFKENWKVSRK